MIRLLRGLIYGIAAGIAAAFVIDHLDNWKRVESGGQPRLGDGSTKPKKADSVTDENLNDNAKQALLDELGAQL